jgi:hypothetical protein
MSERILLTGLVRTCIVVCAGVVILVIVGTTHACLLGNGGLIHPDEEVLYTAAYSDGLMTADITYPPYAYRTQVNPAYDHARAIVYDDGYLYMADWWGQIVVYDVRDTLALYPDEIEHFEVRPYCCIRNLSIRRDRLYAQVEWTQPYGIAIIDISNPNNLHLVDFYSTPDQPRTVEAAGDSLLLWTAGPQYVPGTFYSAIVHNENSIELLGQCQSRNETQELIIRDDTLAYAPDGYAGFTIYNFARPDSPSVFSYCETPGFGFGLAVNFGPGAGPHDEDSTRYVYMADYWDYVQVIDCDTPSAPVLVYSLPAGNQPLGVQARGNYLYVMTTGGAKVYDLTDPAYPVYVAEISCDAANDAAAVAVYCQDIVTPGSFLYLYGEVLNEGTFPDTIDATMEVWQNSQLIHDGLASAGLLYPDEHEVLWFPGFYVDSTIGTEYSVKLTALLDGDQNPGNDVYQKTVRVDTLFVGAQDGPVDLPEELIITAYPNPFNPTTRFDVSLPETGELLLDIFDVLGRNVATLADGVFPAGVHNFAFDAQSLASGVYLARAVTKTETATSRIVLIR